MPGWFADLAWSHARRVEVVSGWERGEGLEGGQVACTTRFLEVEGELTGVVNVRHELTACLRFVGGHVGYAVRPSARRRGHGTALLRGGLDVCARLGIERALVTCDATNDGSIAVIRRHGGRAFEREARAGKPDVLRFWVPTQ